MVSGGRDALLKLAESTSRTWYDASAVPSPLHYRHHHCLLAKDDFFEEAGFLTVTKGRPRDFRTHAPFHLAPFRAGSWSGCGALWTSTPPTGTSDGTLQRATLAEGRLNDPIADTCARSTTS